MEMGGEAAFPGKRSVVIHTCGCNLRCVYCGYGGFLGSCEKEGEVYDWDYLRSYLEKRLDRIDAVVFSGGEPTLQEDLPEYLHGVRELGLEILLETNGTQPDVIRNLLAQGLLDYIAMDVKAPLENYANLVGRRIDTEQIRTSIWIVKQSGISHEFRTTVVPGLHTTRELKAIAELVHGAERYAVQDFVSTHPLRRELEGRPAFPHKALEDIRAYVERRVGEYVVRHSAEARPMPAFKRRRRSPAAMAG